MVRVKICGVTTIDMAIDAVLAGADAVGLNFVPSSPRFIDHALGREMVAELGPFAASVGVFADVLAARQTLEHVRLHAVQTYDTTPVAPIGVPHILTARIRSDADLEQLLVLATAARASALLVDAYSPDALGGTGRIAPWELLEGRTWQRPLILAGGLTPDNVANAIRIVRPWGVDVASGVESGVGVKDPQKVRDFLAAVRGVTF